MAYKIKNTQKDTTQSANYYATTPEDKRIEKEMEQESLFEEENQEEKPSESKSNTMEEENRQIDQAIGNTDSFEEGDGIEPDNDDETFLEEDETWGIDRNDDPHADRTYKIGDRVRVRSDNDNENYNSFKEKTLKITDVDKDFDEEGGYLYSFEDEDGNEINSSLYAWELESA